MLKINYKFFKSMFVLVLIFSLLSCDSNKTTTMTTSESDNQTITTTQTSNINLYQEIDTFFNNFSTNRYMSVYVEYSHRDLINTQNSINYDIYYGIDYSALYMDRIITTESDNDSVPNDIWVDVQNGSLCINQGIEETTTTVLSETNGQNAFYEYVDIDYSGFMNTLSNHVVSLPNDTYRIEYDYFTLKETLPILFIQYPILDLYKDNDQSIYIVNLSIDSSRLTINIQVDSNALEFVPDLLTNINISISYPESITKIILPEPDPNVLPDNAPNLEIVYDEITCSSVDFTLNNPNPDILTIQSVKLYFEDNYLYYINKENLYMDSLTGNTTYTIIVEATYDLNDGN